MGYWVIGFVLLLHNTGHFPKIGGKAKEIQSPNALAASVVK